MKRLTSIILILLYSLLLFAEEQQNIIDSLQIKLETSTNKEWVSTALLLSEKLFTQEPELSESLLNEAINYANTHHYELLLADAYQMKGSRAYSNNKVLTGITLYEKSLSTYNSLNIASGAVNSLIGIANGLTRINKNKQAIDTLIYAIHNHRDSINPEKTSDIYHLISTNYHELGQIESAISYLDSAAYIEKENGLLYYLANTYNTLGIIYNDIGDNKNAIFYYDESENAAKQINDTLLISYALHNKALIYYEWGVFDEALDLFLMAKNISIQLGKNEELPLSLSSIGLIYHEINDIEKAKEYYWESIRLAEKYDEMEIKSVSLHNLGELMYKEKKYDSALILLNQSLKYEMEAQNVVGIAESKSMIASVYIALDKYPLAFEYFKDAEKVFLKFGSKNNLANLYLEIAKGHAKLENDSLSIHFFNQAIQLSEQLNARNIITNAYLASSKNYERQGNFKMALKNYKRYKQINDSIYDENARKRIDYLGLRLEKQANEKQLERLESEKKLLKADQQTRSIQLIAAIIGFFLILIFFVSFYIMNKKSKERIQQQYEVLLQSEQKIKALLDASFDSTLLIDQNGIVKAANRNSLSGFLPETAEIINRPILPLFEETNQKVLKKYTELVYSSKIYKELRLHEKNQVILNIKISPVQDINGNVNSLAFYIQDITQIELDKLEKKKMEEQLIQSQKLETIGTLAGGIAHDFNNYLGTIKGYVGMSLEDSEPDSSVHNYLTKTMKAVNMSQETIKKLLAFSRTKDMQFDKFKLDDLMIDSIDIVNGAKPRGVKFLHHFEQSKTELLGEKNQLTQVILNICTNAFHAVQNIENATVTLEVTENKIVPDLNHKLCTCIRISDNGIGMTKETQERIYEPFFTTKEVGKGTGLGLSVVSGIIKQHGGKIEVESKFEKGSIFYLYLPII